ncbi:MAG: bifunctional tRNA (5-methylaminomethyl-2-thiouridine)(34)-methyltransferase MnmD/FAD-dependent 5-carboxymethylaminomethyl-2-thiouridine(34) oxidoreductase MnmC [Aeromonadaceae bacterium]
MSTPSPLSPLLEHAQLSWDDTGAPHSDAFDDIYFSNNNGLDETRYVFLQQNGLPDRWSQHDRPLFVIAETGFGTGLNFLATWQAFRTWRQQKNQEGAQRLHFISFEKYPLTQSDLALALKSWPELAPLSAQLLDNYPEALPGCHRVLLDQGEVILDLWLGDIKETLDQLWQPDQGGLVDAWYLDGFAPSKNPDMWTEQLFTGLARLARPGATLATFTCAGFVRRGLIAAGFAMQKVTGHGNKRHMLVGVRSEQAQPLLGRPCYSRPAARGGSITILGGGLASACLALALVRRGRSVELLCADAEPAQGASGNRQGALYPLLNAEHDMLSQYYGAAFGFAHRLYRPLLAEHEVAHHWCGVLQFAHDAKSAHKLAKLADAHFPSSLLRPLEPAQRDELAALPLASDYSQQALFYPQGGWLSPRQLTEALLQAASHTGLLQIRYQCEVNGVEQQGHEWLLQSNQGELGPCANLVLATGHRLTESALTSALPVYPVRGQVTHLPAQPATVPLKSVLCYEGYMTPDYQGYHCLGASYDRNQTGREYSAEEQGENLAKLQRSLPQQTWPQAIKLGEAARIAIRAATRDHLPLVGAIPALASWPQRVKELSPEALAQEKLPYHDGVWVIGALGSRGLCSAPLLGEILACELCGEPQPLAWTQLEALHPARSWLRPALRGKKSAFQTPENSGDEVLA